MKRNIKLKGQLRNYMYWPLILTILLVVLNVPIYMINTKSGAVVSCFTVIYFVIVCISYNYNKPVLVNELISFATQYGTVQKRLLDEFEIPYALLDHNGKVLWFNQSFSEMTEKQREAFVMYFRDGMTQEEIASNIGVSRDSVNDRLEGALKKAKKYF